MKASWIRLSVISLSLIITFLIGKPYYDTYKQQQKYNFSLDTADGPVTLSDFKGKSVAIYFGFMHCPDVCPASLSLLSQSLASFSEEELNDFVGLFVSVDPKRDKLKELKEYTQYFHSSFIGATSSETNLRDITKRYGSYFAYEEPINNDPMNYLVAHTSYLYIFDKKGNLSSKLKHDALIPKEIKKALEKVL